MISALLAPPTLGQSLPTTVNTLRTPVLPTQTVSGSPVHEIVACDLDGDQRTDLVRLFGAHPVVHFGAGVFEAASLFDTSLVAADIAVVPDVSPGHDGLVAAGASGITLLTWDASSGVQQTPINTTATDKVTVADHNGETWVVGLTGGGTSLSFTKIASGAASTSYSLSLGGSTGLDVQALHWSSPVSSHIAVRTADGIEIRSMFTILVDAFTTPFTSVDMAPIELAGSGLERLAWVVDTPMFGQIYSFALVLDAAHSPSSGIPIGYTGVSGVTVGRLTDDPEPDLLAATPESLSLAVLFGKVPTSGNDVLSSSPAASFDHGLTLGPPLAANPAAAPLLVDLDNSGSLDVVADAPGFDAYWVAWNDAASTSAQYAVSEYVIWQDKANKAEDVLVISTDPELSTLAPTDTAEVLVFQLDNGIAQPEPLASFSAPYGSGDQVWSVPLGTLNESSSIVILSRGILATGEAQHDRLIEWTPSEPLKFFGEQGDPAPGGDKTEGTDRRPRIDFGDPMTPPGGSMPQTP